MVYISASGYCWCTSQTTDLLALVSRCLSSSTLSCCFCPWCLHPSNICGIFCVIFLAVVVSVQPNAHLHSSALNIFQVPFVVSSGVKSNLVNKLMICWCDVLFLILNWKASLQVICYILPLLGNCNEERDLCLLSIPFRLFLSEEANFIFQIQILQEIGQSCSILSVCYLSITYDSCSSHEDQIILEILKAGFYPRATTSLP